MVIRITTVIAASTTATCAGVSARDTHSIALAIEPGPVIIGIAIGKTLMSSASGVPSIASARFSRRSVRRSNTMSRAMKNSMMPPAMRKLARLMPSAWSSGRPSSAKNIRIAQAISDERIAIARRCAGGRAAGQAGEDRRAARRIDDHQEGDQRRAEQLDHFAGGAGTSLTSTCA